MRFALEFGSVHVGLSIWHYDVNWAHRVLFAAGLGRRGKHYGLAYMWDRSGDHGSLTWSFSHGSGQRRYRLSGPIQRVL